MNINLPVTGCWTLSPDVFCGGTTTQIAPKLVTCRPVLVLSLFYSTYSQILPSLSTSTFVPVQGLCYLPPGVHWKASLYSQRNELYKCGYHWTSSVSLPSRAFMFSCWYADVDNFQKDLFLILNKVLTFFYNFTYWCTECTLVHCIKLNWYKLK